MKEEMKMALLILLIATVTIRPMECGNKVGRQATGIDDGENEPLLEEAAEPAVGESEAEGSNNEYDKMVAKFEKGGKTMTVLIDGITKLPKDEGTTDKKLREQLFWALWNKSEKRAFRVRILDNFQTKKMEAERELNSITESDAALVTAQIAGIWQPYEKAKTQKELLKKIGMFFETAAAQMEQPEVKQFRRDF